MVDKAADDLRNAIIMQAVKDLKKIYQALKKNPESKRLKAIAEHEERFFSSDWYKTLTSIDGTMVVSHLRKEAGL